MIGFQRGIGFLVVLLFCSTVLLTIFSVLYCLSKLADTQSKYDELDDFLPDTFSDFGVNDQDQAQLSGNMNIANGGRKIEKYVLTGIKSIREDGLGPVEVRPSLFKVKVRRMTPKPVITTEGSGNGGLGLGADDKITEGSKKSNKKVEDGFTESVHILL